MNGTGALGRREHAKAERRQRIVRAARELVRETGQAGLSMRAIAARAGVSITTPYNLFGSKRAIVIAVLEDVREFHERYAHLARLDALDRIFAALAISLGYYRDDPDFYRALWSEALTPGAQELRGALGTPERLAFWTALLDEAAGDGMLLAGLDHVLLQQTLDSVFVAVMMGWVLGELDIGDVEPAITQGYALVLRGAASPAGATRIEPRLRTSQALLRARAEARRGRSQDQASPRLREGALT